MNYLADYQVNILEACALYAVKFPKSESTPSGPTRSDVSSLEK